MSLRSRPLHLPPSMLESFLRPSPRAVPRRLRRLRPLQQCRFATAMAVNPPPVDNIPPMPPAIERHAPLSPPSYKPAFLRKTQLHRQYTSLLRSTPLMLIFQHNNLKAAEWASIRRELSEALYKTSKTSVLPGMPDPADSTRITTVQTSIFSAALRVVEFYHPQLPEGVTAEQLGVSSLSKEAYVATLHHNNPKVKTPHKKWRFESRAITHKKKSTPMHRLLHGPIAVLRFPDVTPQHLAAALSILAPTPGAASAFPAPRRKTNPGYYEDAVQTGLKKLVLLGARVEGKLMDGEKVRWIGGLAKSGGLEGLRAQLVHILQGVGGGITSALEGASRSIWLTMESRRTQLDEGEKKPGEPELHEGSNKSE